MQTNLQPGQRVLVEAEVIRLKPARDGYVDVKIYDHYYYAEDGSELEDAENLRLPAHHIHTLPTGEGWRKNPDYDTNGFTAELSCGDRILVAVPLHKDSGGGFDIHLIVPTESGFDDPQGDPWDMWSWSGVEYFMPLPPPPQQTKGISA